MIDFHNSEGSQAAIGLAYAGAQEGSSSSVQLSHPAGLGLVGVYFSRMLPIGKRPGLGAVSNESRLRLAVSVYWWPNSRV